jgi:integrase/recombinase XerD
MSNIKAILYTGKKLNNGAHPVMLYIYENSKAYRLSLGYSCHKKDFDKKNGKLRSSFENAKAKNLNIRKALLRANEIVDDFVRQGERFDYDKFKKLFKGEKEEEKYFYEFFEEMIEEKKALDKVGSMKTYKDALSTLRKYHPKDFKFDKFDYNFLKGLENELFGRGCTGGGIGVRMRTIKAVYYEAVRRGYAQRDLNPYSTTVNKDGYSLAKLKSTRNPKALTLEELKLFKSFNIEQHPELADAWMYFMFSFRTFGMNFTDICNLTISNLSKGRINYSRQKTGKAFSILVVDEAMEIIEHFRTNKTYLFPIFDAEFHITPIQKKDRCERVQRKINRGLKRIAKIQGIETHITFYTARHTTATTMKRKGVATDIISEALGHSDLQVTQNYLSKFSNDVLDGAIMGL